MTLSRRRFGCPLEGASGRRFGCPLEAAIGRRFGCPLEATRGARFGWPLEAARLRVAVVLALLLCGCGGASSPPLVASPMPVDSAALVAASPTAVDSGAVLAASPTPAVAAASATPTAPVPTPTRALVPTPTRAPAMPPEPTPTPYSVRVASTASQAIYLHYSPTTGARIQSYPEGTQLLVIGSDVEGDGLTWHVVRAPDGTEGYIPVGDTVP